MARYILINSLLTFFLLLISGSYLTGTKIFIVMSNSMAPRLNKGDLILVRKQESYSVNDVVTFQRGSQVITHRISSSENNFFKTKGDGNMSNDFPRLKASDIIGSVVYSLPYIGTVFAVLKSKYIFVLMLFGIIYYTISAVVRRNIL